MVKNSCASSPSARSSTPLAVKRSYSASTKTPKTARPLKEKLAILAEYARFLSGVSDYPTKRMFEQKFNVTRSVQNWDRDSKDQNSKT